MIDKDIWGYASVALAVLSNVPYIWSVLARRTRPHIFTQFVWGLAAGIAAAAQYTGHAGPGSWAPAVSGLFCFVIILLCFTHGEKTITRGDWISLIISLSAIPLWYITASPLPAALLATLSDAVAYYPTIRKSWMKPREELAFSYAISNLKHVMSLLAMTSYSFTTLVYPCSLFTCNAVLIALLLWRRQIVLKAKK